MKLLMKQTIYNVTKLDSTNFIQTRTDKVSHGFG